MRNVVRGKRRVPWPLAFVAVACSSLLWVDAVEFQWDGESPGWPLPSTNDVLFVDLAEDLPAGGLAVSVLADAAVGVHGVDAAGGLLMPTLPLHADGNGWWTNRVVCAEGLAGLAVTPATTNGAVVARMRVAPDDPAWAEDAGGGAAGTSSDGAVESGGAAPPRAPGLLSEFASRGTAELKGLADFDSLMAEYVRVDPNLAFGPTSSAWPGLPAKFVDRFQSRHTGYVRIPEDGAYTFHLASDDGSRLYLDGTLLVDNDGNHGTVTRSGTRNLEAGDHALRVDYYDNTLTAELSLSWTGPGFAREVVPASALFHDVPQGEMRPSVWLLEPFDGARLPRHAPLVLRASAHDFDGTVEGVAFYADGDLVGEGAETDAGWTCPWPTPPTGACSLVACARDDSGNVRTSDVVRVVFSEPPEGLDYGLAAAFFELPGVLERLPDFASLTSTASFVVGAVDYAPTAGTWPGFPASRHNLFACVLSGFLDVPETGNYVFYVKSDDGSRLFVDDAPVVDNDGQHGFRERSGVVRLEQGLRRLRLEYYENTGDAGLVLSWSGPGFAKEVVQPAFFLRVADDGDADGDGLPDWWERLYGLDPLVAQPPETDSDGDGLPDLFEYATSHTHPLRADSDGDGMPDKWEVDHGLNPLANDALEDPDGDGLANIDEFRAGTDPRNPDTDGDGLSDGMEVRSARSDPLVRDIDGGGATNVSARVAGTAFAASTGTWRTEEDGTVYAAERSGSLTWRLVVPQTGADALAVRVAQHNPFASSSTFDLTLKVDGVFMGRVVLSAPLGAPQDALFFLPEVPPGEHAFTLVWGNWAVNTFLSVLDLRFVGFGGPDADGNGQADWKDARAARRTSLDAPAASSLVSPLCVEGCDLWRDVLEIAVAYPHTNAVVSVVKTIGDGFYADVPLAPEGLTTLALADRSLTNVFDVAWSPLDVFAGAFATNALVVRTGDSVKVGVWEEAGTEVALLRAAGDAWLPVTNWTQTAATPLRFGAPGLYRLDASARVGALARTNAAALVSVVASRFPERAPAILLSGHRDLRCPNLAQGALLEHDADLVVHARPLASGGVELALSTSIDRELGLVSRLDEGGPISDAVQVRPVWADNGTYYRVLQTYPDGSQLVEVSLSLGAFPPGLSLVLEIFASGVTFDDGTRTKTFTAADFDENGLCRVRFVKARGVVSSVCHRTRIYQNGTLIYTNEE